MLMKGNSPNTLDPADVQTVAGGGLLDRRLFLTNTLKFVSITTVAGLGAIPLRATANPGNTILFGLRIR